MNVKIKDLFNYGLTTESTVQEMLDVLVQLKESDDSSGHYKSSKDDMGYPVTHHPKTGGLVALSHVHDGSIVHIKDAKHASEVEDRMRHHLIHTHKLDSERADHVMEMGHEFHNDEGEPHLSAVHTDMKKNPIKHTMTKDQYAKKASKEWLQKYKEEGHMDESVKLTTPVIESVVSYLNTKTAK